MEIPQKLREYTKTGPGMSRLFILSEDGKFQNLRSLAALLKTKTPITEASTVRGEAL